jgi:hypothetical protein
MPIREPDCTPSKSLVSIRNLLKQTQIALYLVFKSAMPLILAWAANRGLPLRNFGLMGLRPHP